MSSPIYPFTTHYNASALLPDILNRFGLGRSNDGRPSESLESSEMVEYLRSLQRDIEELDKETTMLKTMNYKLRSKLAIRQQEKDLKIAVHAKEKSELEKALIIENQRKVEALEKINSIKLKIQYLSPVDSLPVRSCKHKSSKPSTNIHTAMRKFQKAHQHMKTQLKALELSTSITKSNIIWRTME